jgi:endonuclease/exonuclease/phosphatase (EEP) superfamily protein YafD
VTTRERLVLRWLSGCAWFGSAVLLGFSIARWAGYGGAIALVLYGFTPWLYLPVYGAVGFAFASRQRVLLGVTLAIVVIHAVTIWPDVKPADRISAQAKAAPRLRVFSANLYFENDDISGIIDEVRSREADVAVFQEVTRAHRTTLVEDPRLKDFEYRVSANTSDTMVMSRVPIESSEIWTEPARWLARARLSTAIGTVELVDVHTVAPVDRTTRAHWRQMFDVLRDLAHDHEHPLLLIGDFNATVYHPQFDDLLDAGLTDAHSARGKGLTGTWPRDRAYPPVLRIDHALSSRELVPVSAAYGKGRGSDHRPIFVEYALVGGATS